MFNFSGEHIMQNKKVFKVEMHITEHCNLNCVCCEHFSPLAECDNIDVDYYADNLKRMRDLLDVDTVVAFYILGGEPTLHPELDSILKVSRAMFDNKELHTIRLVTNGILLRERDADFWDICKDNDIVISVSQYPIKLDYLALENNLKELGVKFEIFHAGLTKYMRYSPIDLDGKQNVKESFEMCPITHRCCFLKDFKIYSCPKIPNIFHLNKEFGLNLKITERDYLDLNDVKCMDDIWKFLDTPNEFCRFCDVKSTRTDVEWRVSLRSRKEWIL